MRVWSRADANDLAAVWVLADAGSPNYVLALFVRQLATGFVEGPHQQLLHYVLGIGAAEGEDIRSCPLAVLEDRTFPSDDRGLQWSEELKARYLAHGWIDVADKDEPSGNV